MSREDGGRDHGLCEKCSSHPCMCTAMVRRAEASLARLAPTPESPDPFSQLRDELAALEDEATRLLSGQRENARIELSPIRRVFVYVERLRSDVRNAGFDIRRALAAAEEKNRLFAERLKQLEGIVQSAFARAVRGLSANAPAAQAGADKVVRLVEEHAAASRFLDENEVPGVSMLARVQWLHDKATQTIVTETEQFFQDVELSRPKPVRGAVIDVDTDAGEWRCDCPPDAKFDTSVNPVFVKHCDRCGKSRPNDALAKRTT